MQALRFFAILAERKATNIKHILMTLKEAIEQRHSVRKYIHKPLTDEVVDALQKKLTSVTLRVTCIYNLLLMRRKLLRASFHMANLQV